MTDPIAAVPRPGGVLWITGLSGAGKTTLARVVTGKLREEGAGVVLLDGDAVRELISPSAGHTSDERRAVAFSISRLCRYLALQGMRVVCSTISMFDDCRDWNRANIPRYFEAYIKVPLEILRRRDTKGLYRKSMEGAPRNVVGVDIPAQEPRRPDWVWENTGPLEDLPRKADELIAAARQVLA